MRLPPAGPLALLVLSSVLLAGCAHDEGGAVHGPVYGVSLSPADMGDGFARFWVEAEAMGSVIAWAGPIEELADPKGGARVVATLNEETGFHTAIMTSPYSSGGDAFARPYDDAARARHLRDLVDLVEDHDVAFLALGVEVDIFAQEDPANHSAFAVWWEVAYDAVKAASPRTHVFPVFQYERLIGLQGGLYGKNNAADPSWDLLDLYPSRDLTAFTTYPGLIYKDPADVPLDHYAPIRAHVSGDLAFTEVGWHAGDRPTLWKSDPVEQARFVDWFFDQAPEATLTLWLHLHDTPGQPPFDSMGLIDPEGGMRPALERWRQRAGT